MAGERVNYYCKVGGMKNIMNCTKSRYPMHTLHFFIRPVKRLIAPAVLFLTVPVFAVCLKAATAPNPGTPKPNFIFVITDDISPDDLGPYGSKQVKTPNLDQLAERALVFDNAYNVISSCSPSRCSIITGRYPHNTGAPELHTKLPPDQATFVQLLRDAGYHTAISGKNHMAAAEQLGFNEESDSKPAGSEKWIQHLQSRPGNKPFFFWFASHDAHYDFDINDHAPVYDPDRITAPPMMIDGPKTRAELAGYFHEVSRTDHYVGEIIKELKAQDILDNTYIIYCSDNGRPFPRCKSYMYQSGIQTPLIIAGPGVSSGRSASLVSSIDYSATILELAGIDKPATVQGVSQVAVLKDPTASVREIAFAERNWHVNQLHERAVRTGDWLYIWNAWPNRHNVSGESSWEKFPAAAELWEAAANGTATDYQALLTLPEQPPEMLFNVKEDPYQFRNLVDNPEYADILKKMRAHLDRWKQATGDSVQTNPTQDRQPLRGGSNYPGWKHREFPGAANQASRINDPGPVHLR